MSIKYISTKVIVVDPLTKELLPQIFVEHIEKNEPY